MARSKAEQAYIEFMAPPAEYLEQQAYEQWRDATLADDPEADASEEAYADYQCLDEP